MDRPSSSDQGYQASIAKNDAMEEMSIQDPEVQTGDPARSSIRYLFRSLMARLPARAHQLRTELVLFGISLVYMFLVCWFTIVVLIHGNVETPLGVFWGFSTTNLMVTILSQISAYLIDSIIRSYLALLRRVFLAKPKGLSFASYVGLGEASGWFTVFQISAMNWFLNLYCNFR